MGKGGQSLQVTPQQVYPDRDDMSRFQRQPFLLAK